MFLINVTENRNFFPQPVKAKFCFRSANPPNVQITGYALVLTNKLITIGR